MQFNRLNWREITMVWGAAALSRPGISLSGRENPMCSPHRRELLQRLLAVALAIVPSWHNDAMAATLPVERDRFVELSEKLCAMSIDDGFLADVIQNALVDQYSDDDLRRIAELLHSSSPQEVDRVVVSSGLHTLIKSIISTWYSGWVGSGERTRVLAYAEALAWKATGYAKAPGTCGEFGDWTTKPPTAPDRERRP